jgi:membrane peptidoglycan carboxypeptidase
MSDNSTNWEQQDKNYAFLHADSLTSDFEEQQQQLQDQQAFGISTAPKGNASQTLPTSSERPDIIPKRPRNAHVPDQLYNLVANTLQVVRGWTGKMVAIADQVMQPPATPPTDSYPAPASGVSTPLPEPSKRWKRSRTLRITMMRRQRRARWQRERPKTSQIGTGILTVLALLLVILTGSGTAYGYTYYQSQLPRVQKLENQQISQTTRIYDRNMTLLYDAYDNGVQGGRRTPVTYDEVPEVMRDAIIASEDPSFWSNTGIDPQGILRASISFLQHDAVQSGGSTLTQQVIKNLTGNTEVTLNRKVLEAVLAIGLTQQYPKWKILEMYFNVASFGPVDMGIESAVEEYFHLMPQCNQNFKCIPGVSQLDLDQQTNKHDPLLGLARASLLAGLPQNPVRYYPAGGSGTLQSALNRQKYVLGQMIKQNMSVQGLGPVTPTIAKKAEALTAQMKFTPYQHIKHAPHFVDWVINQIETALGNGDPNKGIAPFLTGGFNIRTTIDLKLENFVESTVDFHLTQPEFHWFGDSTPINEAHNINDAAVVVMNAHTGEILAMNGSADYNNPDPKVGGEYNAADPLPNADGTPAGRQTGSSFKPFVYATAFEMGWYPGMVVPDVQTFFPNGAPAGTSIKDAAIYHPPDYSVNGNPNYYGGDKESTVRESLAQSRNVGAVKAMEYAGPENVLTTVHRLGLTEIQNLGVSWALGTENVTVLQMTDAYQTFANGGKRIPPQGILDIWDNYGHNLFHYDPTHPSEQMVFSPQVSYLITSILTDEPDRIPDFGGDHDLSFSDIDSTCAVDYNNCQHQVAAKTGTTDGPKDNWTMGYTPNVVVGVWSGNADNEAMYPGTTGVAGAAPIWHSVIEAVAGTCPSPTYPTVPCPPNYDPTSFAHELGVGQQQTFVAPAGVTYACTSKATGLLGGDNCDWMVDGEEPTQSGAVPNNNTNGDANNPFP